ncbi:Aminopeptidase 2 mitochondrial [Malassezia nana]|uniref:Aminopeptidase n=1 Tax=Malassezia nana TaxID=180528 RepID=A0AAF0J3U7_9BASI|nr:Aminopeptidase 2 mitochondrial [Malassezia nana]
MTAYVLPFFSQQPVSYQLPTHVRPTHYDLTIFSDLVALQFQGAMRAQLEVQTATNQIEFQAGANLALSDVQVCVDGRITSVQPHVDRERERVQVRLATPLSPGADVQVLVGFRARLDQSLRGYYYSTWAHEGKNGTHAVTQFSPASGRRAFPGWDEPAFKATYTFRLIHSDTTQALANMPAVRSTHVDAAAVARALHTDEVRMSLPPLADQRWVLTEFEETPRMSSYLVGWANGVFEHRNGSYTSPLTGRTVPLRIYATADYAAQTEHGLDVMQRELPIYENLFGIAYPLPKLDGLVVADFDVNAMENWGLITSRTSVFACAKTSDLAGLKSATGTIGHELGHMWFGNMVTMAWWDNLWLKEAFATLMGEVLVLRRAFPEWDTQSDFVAAHVFRAMELDAMRASHPIETPLNTEHVEKTLTQTFDAIPYSKGASVLRMLTATLGESEFLKGVNAYLDAHLYGNTVTDDLWRSLSEASGRDVRAIMSTWTLQQGFPVVQAVQKDTYIQLRQTRFLETGPPTSEEDETLWHIPLALRTFYTEDSEVNNVEIPGRRTYKIPLPRGRRWKLNADTTGFYRVQYTPSHLRWLMSEAETLSVADRMGLLSDVFALGAAGYNSMTESLDGMTLFESETSAAVLQVLAQSMATLASVWWEQPEDVQECLRAWQADVFGPWARKCTLDASDDQPAEWRQLRAVVVDAAAAAGDAWTLQAISAKFKQLEATGDDAHIPADLLRTVLRESVRRGDAGAFDVVWRMYEQPRTPTHKIDAMHALSATRDDQQISTLLAYVRGPHCKTQDIPIFYAALSSNPAARRRLWDETRTHWDALAARFERNFSFKNVIRAAIGSLTRHQDADTIESFFRTRDTSTYHMILAQALELVRARAKWLERSASDVQAWCAARAR